MSGRTTRARQNRDNNPNAGLHMLTAAHFDYNGSHRRHRAPIVRSLQRIAQSNETVENRPLTTHEHLNPGRFGIIVKNVSGFVVVKWLSCLPGFDHRHSDFLFSSLCDSKCSKCRCGYKNAGCENQLKL